ncbi:hypothetical protein EXQ31_04280 [Clostridium botulinum]|uniref:hypothetical protein n=1 Tax=Clostridium botulinum TaxID=1491 RepID=UPI001A911677|nr:hypothetical protein [Clostridium botulinum]MBO0525390.1 hypothetical protein [Clostridium botulinum]MBO0527201.1 hypothetical protein [Clostridium botulinum]MBO0533618.1 hypothetical protein [Clostridium botulinum]MBO0536573.1 hypothetical protein [Clostridium botulinum]MBO0540155.1 hypothetical protein [Clostridium botulinum]
MWIKSNCDGQNPTIVKCYRFYIGKCYGMKEKKYVLNGVATHTFWGEDAHQIAYFASKEEAISALDEIVSFLNTNPNGVFEFKK